MSVPQKTTLRFQPPSGSLKLTIPVQKQLTGSATGNPRNKCALKPGHSLMDWIRLGNSGCDLSGTNGTILPVSSQDLSKHCTKDDAWMAIRGNVYNVTQYMDFHPGGPAELMRGVGKDATKMFDDVHAWVNYEQLLKKCLIGPFRVEVKIDTDIFKPLKMDFLPSRDVISLDNIPTKVVPRFDWIQKVSDLTLYFYTKQFCNPGLVLSRSGLKNIEVRICAANCWYHHSFELHDEVNWPPKITQISSESGKIELKFQKTKSNLWTTYGKINESTEQLEDSFYEFEIVRNQNFNHNSFALLLRGKNDTIMLTPVGYHLTFSCYIEGKEVNRSYTPVPKKYSPINNENYMDLHFLFKTYENGLLANYINKLQHKSSVIVSQPKGNLLLHKFLGHTKIALFAAGSGITPMLSIIDHLLARNSLKIEKLILLFFNKTEEDIWCRTVLEELMEYDNRLKITHILSQPTEEVGCHNGHISNKLLSNIKNPSSEMYSTFVCSCGPPVFNTLAETILKTLHFSSTDMHFFNS